MRHAVIIAVSLAWLGSCDAFKSEDEYIPKPYEVEIAVAFSPVHVQPSLRFKQLSAGRGYFCGLTLNGEIWCWGQNSTLQLGSPTRDSYSEQAVRVGIDEEVESVASGFEHSCALAKSGNVYCWGYGNRERGLDPFELRPDGPNLVVASIRLTEIDAASFATCGKADDAKIYCWGRNGNGELVRPQYELSGSSNPIVIVNDSTRLWSIGGATGCVGWVVTHKGELLRWGCGVNKGEITRVDAPGEVAVIEKGEGHVCIISQAGETYCTGANYLAQSGPDLIGRSIGGLPVDLVWQRIEHDAPFVDLSLGHDHSCGLEEDGDIFCWGANNRSQISMDSLDVCLLEGYCFNYLETTCIPDRNVSCAKSTQKVASDEIFVDVIAGYAQTCGITEDGRAICWGTKPVKMTKYPGDSMH